MLNQTQAAVTPGSQNQSENDGSRYASEITQMVNYVFVCGVISVFGTGTNVINMIIFYRQGLETTINISFFALAVSDLCSLIMQQCFNIFVNPWLENLGVPGVSSGIQYIVGGIPRETFARITFLITVYITAERCFCIVFPLQIKQMITPRRTAIVIILINTLTIISAAPLFCTTSIGLKFNPQRNVTLLGLILASNSDSVEGAIMVMQVVVGTLSFLLVVLFTIILIHKLNQKSDWRKAASGQQKQNETMSNRDRKTMITVVLIATILIVSYTPSVILYLSTFIEPEFSIGGKYWYIYTCSWSIAFVFECINSSVNIFLYYKMSTKYRTTFNNLFNKCLLVSG